MTPHIPKGAKGYQIDRRFPGVGRLRIQTGTRNKRKYARFDSFLTELYEDGRLELLRALKARRVTLRELYDASRRGALSHHVHHVVMRRPLWPAIDEWLPGSAPAASSRKRYEVSMKKLARLSGLDERATVADLERVEWGALRRRWGGAADWNRMRAAVSRFLTMTLGDKWHPFRRRVMGKMPRAREPRSKRPDITLDSFWQVVANTREHARPAYVALLVTGARIGEYLALEERHLMPHTRSLYLPGTKTRDSERVIGPLGANAWAWLERAVPPPLRYKWTRLYWKEGCRAVGVDYRLHDIRHLHGHLLADAGLADSKIASQLGHAHVGTTRRYTEQRDMSEAARAVEDWMEGVA